MDESERTPPADHGPTPLLWCRMTLLGPAGETTSGRDLAGYGRPDLSAVDTIAHEALAAARAGGRLLLRDVEPQLVDLLRLSGLLEEAEGLVVQMERQPEGGEEPLGVEEREEEGHLGDLPA